MSQIALLQTKLYVPPIRTDLVSRPRLIEQLSAGLGPNQGLGGKLTVISAPAGFGKTTLVTQWLNSVQCPRTWLSLDENDNEIARFLTYLIAALRAISRQDTSPPREPIGHVGQGMLHVLQSPQPPPTEAVLTALINDLVAFPDRILLVLDDYHLIETQAIHDALAFLLEHLPPQLHLVIVSREDPPLLLARLRAQGQLTEVRATDLRFTPSEAAEFLNQTMDLGLPAEDISTLEARTEGWIAGLQLAAVSMKGSGDVSGLVRAFTGSHRYVLDYLTEEVLVRQSETVQTFLLKTSVLNRLTGSLCDAVRFGFAEPPAGREDGQAVLEMLDRANLFIAPLDNERRWYRYHHLFADLLRQRLRQTQPDELPTLHSRASEWYERNGFVDEAIEHALRSQDFELAVSLIENVVEAMWGRDKHSLLQRWLDMLPIEVVFTKPHLCVFLARHLFPRGQQDAAERALQAAEQALDPKSDLTTRPSLGTQDRPTCTDRAKLLGRIAATRSLMASYRSDFSGILPHAHQALEHLPEQDTSWRGSAAIALGDAYVFQGDYNKAYRTYQEALELIKLLGNPYLSLHVYGRLALVLRAQGKLQLVTELCSQQVELAKRNSISQTEPVGWLLAIWGETLAEADDLDDAVGQVKKGVEAVRRGRDVAMLAWSSLCLTRVLFSRGDMAGAEKIIMETENLARESIVPLWVTNSMAAWQVRIWLVQGRLDEALQWLRKRKLDPSAEPTYVGALEYAALTRIFIAQERYDDATKLLKHLLEPAGSGGHTSRSIEILLLQTLALQAAEDTDGAIAVLEKALSLAGPRGFVRIFVDEGPSMARLLYEALSRDIFPDYVRRLLAAFPMPEPKQDDQPETQAPESDLIEPLSQRETEVLQLIAQGLSNREIGERLFIALPTVKGHNRRIYGKLQVQRRTEAVARARELGLL